MKLDHVPSLNVADAPTQDDTDWYLAQLTGRDPSTLRAAVPPPPAESDDVTWMPARPAPRARGRAVMVGLAAALIVGVGCIPVTLGTRDATVVRADSAHPMPAELRGNTHTQTPVAPPAVPAGGTLPDVPATNDEVGQSSEESLEEPPEQVPPPPVRHTTSVDQPMPTPEPTDPATPDGEPSDPPSSGGTPPAVPSDPGVETPPVEP